MAEFPRKLASDGKDKEISPPPSEPEDSLHDFSTVGALSFQAATLLTIHMEMEGSGRADSHVNLICP